MKLAIITATYDRPKQSSIDMLKHCWEFLSSQTHTEWKWFLTGDAYENNEEITSFVNTLPPEKISFENMKTPGERGILKGGLLWCNAGATAMNASIERALGEGFEWMAHLDDDDSWEDNHLESIFKGILFSEHAICVHTQSKFLKLKYPFPKIPGNVMCSGAIRLYSNVVHSSTAVKFSDTDLRYKTRGPVPADADLWNRLTEKHGKESLVHVPILTVHHTEEGNPNL